MTERSRPPAWKLYGLISLMTVLWAVNFVIAKIALRELPPLLTAGLRTGLAGLAILPVFWWHRRTDARAGWRRSDLPVLIVLGMFGVALNQLFFVVGISRTSVAHAAVMIGLTPLMVLLIASATGLERLRGGRIAGMAIALGGVALLQAAPGKTSGATWYGDVFILGASLTFALFTVMGKRVAKSFTSITLNTFAYVGGGLMLLPVTFWEAARVPLASVTWTAWAAVAYMALFPSVLCYVIYYYALTWIPASRVSAFAYTQPLLATLLAIPALGERPTPSLIGGAVLVLAGVMITERL